MLGSSIGRYVVLSRLGEGGMGVVYAAYDPELDRKVAVKLLRERLGDAAELRARLLREAQAMARLSHPNVVAVHDVGGFEDKVFVAMEFIDGLTLAEWLKEKPRTWREVLAVFRQAGKGLAAAHSAGLVHRDFKPGNVLVGKDESVKVTDFGLAFTPSSGPGETPSAGTPGAMLVAGTPAYMAPEQLRGEVPDARADQYSFCVALYQALTAEHPADGTTFATLASQLVEASSTSDTFHRAPGGSKNELIQLPKGTGVPRWVLGPVLKGLSEQPSKRFQSLNALLKALEEPVSPWKRVAGGLAVAAVVATCIVAYRVTVHQQSLVCKGAQEKLAGIWDSAREEAIHQAFLSTDKPYAAAAFDGVKRALDAHSQAWAAMHTEACEATRLRGEQSEALLDLRIGCLGSRLDEMRALSNLFAKADAQVVEKSVEAAHALTPLRGCADSAALSAQVKPPEDAATLAQVEKYRSTLAEIKALKDTGKYLQGLEVAKPLLASAKETHYRPLEGEALLMLGELYQATTKTKEAREVLPLAANIADEVRDDERRARALTLLAFVVGYQATQIDEGLRLARDAGAVVARLGNPPELESRLKHVVGNILVRSGKHQEGAVALKQGLDILQKVPGADTINLAKAFTSVGNALWQSGQYEESFTYLQKSVEISEKGLGPDHPQVAEGLNNLGILFRKQGKYDASLEAQQRALVILEKVFGPKNPRVALSLMNQGTVFQSQGRDAQALSLFRRALEIQEEVLGTEHADLINTLGNLGLVSRDMGDLEASVAYFRRALAIAEKALGPEHPVVPALRTRLGNTLCDQGNYQSAVENFRRALAFDEKVLGPQHSETSETLEGLARALYQQDKQKNFEVAIGYLNRALASQEKAVGAESPDAAEVLDTLGAIESDRKQKIGLAHLQRALDIREKRLPAESPLIATSLSKLGEAYLNLKQPSEAKPHLERASKLLESIKGNPVDLAWTRFLLARSLWDTHSEGKQAIALAQQARSALLTAGKASTKTLQQVDAWLSTRLRGEADLSLRTSKREGL